jgi:hypothetical protein
MSDINWDEAPEWASCAVKNKITGIVQFANKTSNGYFRANENCSQFIMGDNAWSVIESRPANEDATLTSIKDIFSQIQNATNNKYERELTDRYSNTCHVDVYDVLLAFEVTCPAIQHAIKKLLCTGIRGHKDSAQDLLEAKESITRAIELATKS